MTRGSPRADLPASPEPRGFDLDVPAIRERLALIKEARSLFGEEQARRLWILIGLPDLAEVAPADSVAKFLGRVRSVPGACIQAAAFYASYLTFCRETDARAVSPTRFGREMRTRFARDDSGRRRYYMDVVVDAAEMSLSR